MKSFALLTVWLPLTLLAQSAAPPLAFEVVSVKISSAEINGWTGRNGKGTVQLENIPLRRLVMNAYKVRDFQLVAPDWLSGVKLDVIGKMPNGAAPEQRFEMLQTMLAERFKLTVHRESKEMNAYALVLAKAGSKLVAAPLTASGSMSVGPGQLTGTKMSISSMIVQLSNELERPIVDQTGLTGEYDVKLRWSPDSTMGGAAENNGDAPAGPSVFAALQEQLGLRLQPQKLPVEMIVIDHIEHTPIEN